MRSGSYPYPADEFDAAARAGGPRGVHRAPRSRWSRWGPFVVVLIVFPALAYGAVTYLSDWNGFGSGSSNDSAQTGGDDGSVPPSPTPTPGATDGAADPGTPTETTAPDAPAAPPADLTRAVEVFNATNTSGLARNAGDRLKTAGFTSVDVGDWKKDRPAASVVYYPTAADVTTAQQAAATLGIATVTESADLAPDGIVVVLADDYKKS